jgi:hypothetical protein
MQETQTRLKQMMKMVGQEAASMEQIHVHPIP